jgi:hypothetical protein
MTWPLDKLSLINQQLAKTGNNLVASYDDGSVEWTCASAAYEEAFEYALDSHDWKQCTNVVTLLNTGTAPADDKYDAAYAKPVDCVHVIWVRAAVFGSSPPDIAEMPAIYCILNNQICVRTFGLGSTPTVKMKYVSSSPPGLIVNGQQQPTSAADQMLRTFMTALGRFVLAGIYRGLSKDIGAARAEEAAAMSLLQQARTRADQEQPKRAPFNSRLVAARRQARPTRSTPYRWGNTDTSS